MVEGPSHRQLAAFCGIGCLALACGIGATDLQVTHLFQRKILIDAFIGSVAGAIAAALVLLLLASGAAIAGELTGGAAIGAGDIVILALPLAFAPRPAR